MRGREKAVGKVSSWGQAEERAKLWGGGGRTRSGFGDVGMWVEDG